MSACTVRLRLFDDLVARSNPREQLLDLRPGPGETTGAELVALVRAMLGTEDVCIVLDGTPWGAAELAATDLPLGPGRPGDVLAAPRPRGPETAVMVILALASAAASAALARVNAPRAATTADGAEHRYGFNRVASDAFVGDPIPVVYGRRPRYGGKVIAKIPVEAADGSGNAKLRMLICLGHGAIDTIGDQTADFTALAETAVSGIYLNDQPLANFPGSRASGRLGAASQAVIPGFTDVETLREVGVGGVELRNTDGVERTGSSASTEAFEFTTVGSVNAVVARVLFPAGLYTVRSSGQVDGRRVKYRYRWRLSGGTYGDWTVVTVERADQSEFVSAPRLDDLVGGGGALVDVQLERVSVESGSAADVDRMVWDSVIEVLYDSETYNGFAMLALELTAGEQLTGVPRVAVDVRGRTVRVWDGVSSPSSPVFTTEYSDNPAWHALDYLTDTVYGMGYADGEIDLATLFSWASYCDEQVELVATPGSYRDRFRFHYALDEHREEIDWLRAICRAGRCTPVPSGGVWTFVVERPQASPVEVFTDGSIAADEGGVALITYRREYTRGGVSRANQVVCQFENELQDGQPEALEHPEPGTLWLGPPDSEPVRSEHIRLDGVTHPEQVSAELVYYMDRARFLTRSVRFVTTKPVVAVQPGDRFDLATSLVGWGLASGRLRAGSTTTAVVLDRTLVLEESTAYFIQVRRGDNSIETLAIAAAAGTYAPGDAVAVSGAFTTAPEEWEEYSVGQEGVVMKPFTATAVRPYELMGKLCWEVEGLEYDDEVYDAIAGNVSMPTYSSLGGLFTPPGPVVDLRGFERNTNGIPQVVLSWSQEPADAQRTQYFKIYRRRLGTATWVLVPGASVAWRGAVIELGEFDVAYQFCVVAVSPAGAHLSPYDSQVPIVTIVFGLGAAPPEPPANPTLTPTGGNTYTLSWDPVEDAVEYQVLSKGASATGVGAGIHAEVVDSLVVARTEETELAGLELPPGYQSTFWVRSVAENGRLSWTATGASVTASVPGGEALKQDVLYDSATAGVTLTNCSWVTVSTVDRLRMTSAGSDAVWELPEEDPGSLSLTELTLLPRLCNDAEDPALEDDPFSVPSIAADQWGVVSVSPPVVGMLMPPWPDEEQTWLFEVRTHDGTVWSDWEALTIGASIRRVFRQWQLRVTMRRENAPYRPAILDCRVVLTH